MKMEGDSIHSQDHAAATVQAENSDQHAAHAFLEGTGFFNRYDTPAAGEIYRSDVVCDRWLLDDLICDAPVLDLSEDHVPTMDDRHAILSWSCALLSASPSARRMLGEAAVNGWSLALEPLGGPDFHLDVPQKLIVLDTNNLLIPALGRSEYFRNALLISFARALRDIWQEKRHGAFDEVYGPEAVLSLERVRAADLDVMAVLIAWELRGEGASYLWRHMIGSEEGDMALRFTSVLEREPAAAFTNKALQAAFVQWFQEPVRVNACDHETLNALDAILMECGVLSGEVAQPFGDKKLTPVGVEVLSCLPDKTAYLQGFGDEILRSPTFAGLDDLVNQSHLMQIMHDLKSVRVQGIPFRSVELAAKIFPNGEFAAE